MGSELFERSNKTTMLTPAGELFFFHAQQMLLHLTAAEKELLEYEHRKVDQITVGVGPPAKRFVSRACSLFSDKYPHIELNLMFRDWDETVEKVRKRQIDFGVTNADNYLKDGDLNIVDLTELNMAFFVSPQHPLAGKEAVTPDEFKRYPMVGGLYPIGLSEFLQTQLELSSLRELRVIQCNNKMEMEEFLISDQHIMLGFEEFKPLHTPFVQINVPALELRRPFYSIVTVKKHKLAKEVVELINLVRQTERDYIKQSRLASDD